MFCCRYPYHFGLMSQKLTVFWKRGFGSFIKTAFYVWLAKVRRKNCFFFEKTQCSILFRILVRKFSDYGWKVYGSVVGIEFYVSSQRVDQIGYFESSFTFIGHGAEGSRNSSKQLPAGLSKLHYTCPEDHFDKRYIFWKHIFLKNNSGSWD